MDPSVTHFNLMELDDRYQLDVRSPVRANQVRAEDVLRLPFGGFMKSGSLGKLLLTEFNRCGDFLALRFSVVTVRISGIVYLHYRAKLGVLPYFSPGLFAPRQPGLFFLQIDARHDAVA